MMASDVVLGLTFAVVAAAVWSPVWVPLVRWRMRRRKLARLREAIR